jgi:hypothetical protein
MASTTLQPRSPAPGNRSAPTLVPGGGRQRRWSLALLAILVTLGSALAFVVLWMNAGGREPVLALRNNVAAGQLIEADDLVVVRMSADSGISPIPSSRRDDVIGEPAATNLLAGMLLVDEAVGTADDIDAGSAVIAIPVPTSQIPVGDLETGDEVVLLRTISDAEATEAQTIGSGTVFSVQEDDDDAASDIRVSVIVAETLAAQVANAVSQDQIYVFKTPTG